MKPERYICTTLLALLMSFMTAGCAGNSLKVPKFMLLSGQQRTLAEAVDHLAAGDEIKARELLIKVVDGSEAQGVSDEALFRLALLNLKESGSKGVHPPQLLLKRLSDRYPDSLWTRQAAPLALYLTEVKGLHDRRRELKSLKEQNTSLHQDNRELRQILERLKNLDLELEQKIVR